MPLASPSRFAKLSLLAVGALAAAIFFSNSFSEKALMAAEPAAAPAAKTTQLAHMVYFTLNDSTPENRQKLVDLCKKYLTKHPGEVYFSVGTLADLKRDVNDRGFDVALNVVFESRACARRLSDLRPASPVHRRSQGDVEERPRVRFGSRAGVN